MFHKFLTLKTTSVIALLNFVMSGHSQDLYKISAPAFGIESNYNGISIQVPSGGCTSRENFNVSKSEKNEIKIIQTKPDFCEAYLAYGTMIDFSYEELGVSGLFEFQGLNFGPGRELGGYVALSQLAQLDSTTPARRLPLNLMGITFDYEGVNFQVPSSGCTSKDNFSVIVQETFPVMTEIVRNGFDACRAFFPYGTKIKFSYAELGLQADNIRAQALQLSAPISSIAR